MQWAGTIDAFYAQQFRKADFCLGKQNSSQAWD